MEERHNRNIHIAELEFVAIKAVLDGYNASLSKRRTSAWRFQEVKMKVSILYAMLLCAGSAGFVGWRIHALRHQETRHFEIVEDLSLSHSGECESLLGLAERVLRTEGASSGSTLTVLVIGKDRKSVV